MGTVTIMSEHKKAGRPRAHLLTDTPLGRWVLRHFKGDYLQVARDLGIDISALEKMIRGELNLGAAIDAQFWTHIETQVCPVVARKIGLEPSTFVKWANGTNVPKSASAKIIKYFTEKFSPEDTLDLDALLDYEPRQAA